jgi:hypothetical protein
MGMNGFVDINECIERPGLCNITGQVCRNLEGSYDCLCPLGTEVINGACKRRFSYYKDSWLSLFVFNLLL